MSLVNRQNYTPTFDRWLGANTCPAIIETPSSIWMRGYEHDPSTLTPLFGKQFHPAYSYKLTIGMIYTKYSGCVASVEYNGNSFIDRSEDWYAFNLEDINRGMKDVPLYRWSDGFNYYVGERGGSRFWKLNPNNQNLVDGVNYIKGNAWDSTWGSYPYRGQSDMHIIDEDINNIYTLNVTELGNSSYYRAIAFPSIINKNTNVTTNVDGVVQTTQANGYYIGRSSTRIYSAFSTNYGRTFSLYSYNKAINTITTVYTNVHSGSIWNIPSETFQVDNSGSFAFYYSHLIPSGSTVSASAISARHNFTRVIFNKDGGQASGSVSASINAYGTQCFVDYGLSGSLSPNDLWPASWNTANPQYYSKRTKLFLNSPSSSVKYLIGFGITPYGYEETTKNFYNGLVFEITASTSTTMSYQSYRPIYNDLGSETRAVIAMDDNTNRFLVVTTQNMAIYTFDTGSKSLTLAQTIPGEFRTYGVDTYNRLWACTYNNDLFCFSLDSPVRINITSPTSSYNYAGSSLSGSILVEARNYLGNYVAVPTRLTIEGNSAVFTSNTSSSINITTNTSASITVPITINNGGFTRIVASSNF
jgi:hypothetical protein